MAAWVVAAAKEVEGATVLVLVLVPAWVGRGNDHHGWTWCALRRRDASKWLIAFGRRDR
jgi:hypothetical protein